MGHPNWVIFHIIFNFSFMPWLLNLNKKSVFFLLWKWLYSPWKFHWMFHTPTEYIDKGFIPLPNYSTLVPGSKKMTPPLHVLVAEIPETWESSNTNDRWKLASNFKVLFLGIYQIDKMEQLYLLIDLTEQYAYYIICCFRDVFLKNSLYTAIFPACSFYIPVAGQVDCFTVSLLILPYTP